MLPKKYNRKSYRPENYRAIQVLRQPSKLQSVSFMDIQVYG
jgi:hypothetical protein